MVNARPIITRQKSASFSEIRKKFENPEKENAKEICLICNEDVNNSDAVGCWICDGWLHKSCAELMDRDFETLNKGNDCIEFICKQCKKSEKMAKEINEELKRENTLLKNRCKEMEDKFKKMENDTEGKIRNIVSDQMEKINKNYANDKDYFKEFKSDINKSMKSLKNDIFLKLAELNQEACKTNVGKKYADMETITELKLVIKELKEKVGEANRSAVTEKINLEFGDSVVNALRMEDDRKKKKRNLVLYNLPEP